MSEPRYQPAILNGIAKSHGAGGWPDELPGLGPREHAVFGQCVDCRERLKRSKNPDLALDGSWVTYGGVALCMRHAQGRADRG